jgi:hypothetical protein
LALLFRLAHNQSKLIKHLEALIPLREIKDSLLTSGHYFFFRPFLGYLSCHPSLMEDMLLTNDILIYGMRIIRCFREHVGELDRYHPRVAEKEK